MVLSSGLFHGHDPDGVVGAVLVALGVPRGLDRVHRFEPHGLSWARLAADRRAVIHTWPEDGLLSVDLYAPAVIDLTPPLASCGLVPVGSGSLEPPRMG